MLGIAFVVALDAIGATADQAATSAADLRLEPRNASGIYHRGERVGWTVTRPAESTGPARWTYVIRKNNSQEIQRGELDLAAGAAVIETTLHEPGMLFLKITPQPAAGREHASAMKAVAGAAVAPTELQPCEPRPDDFDEFWSAKIEQLQQIPPHARLTPKESGDARVEYATIQMDHIQGRHVYGQLAKPKGPGKHPALVILQWAGGPYPLDKSWVLPHAAQGWLTLNIQPHDVLPDAPQAYYDALPPDIKNYRTAGCADRETCYYLPMYLAGYRAVDYIAGRADWDGKTLVVIGTSMGGQQALCVAGLHRQITHVIVNVPAGCDLNAAQHCRQAGYPNFPADDPRAMSTARYFDAVNFASRIQARSLVSMGFVDAVCPPAGIWTAFNQIRGPKEAVSLIDSPHNHEATEEQQRPFTQRSEQWLRTLAKGGDPLATPRPATCLPVPREDENSQVAHRQLLAKARQGKIDLYFVGDSITRRWGCTDPQYADLMDNWRANFHGWNAANFGWGSDRTEHILWRLENGELDGVHPKVIVVLAGTNNLGPQHCAEGADGADVAAGVQAIVEVCRLKAPRAKIIVTGLFPRNDLPGAAAVIERINATLTELADGHAVHYLNVNRELSDDRGQFRPEMTTDGVHLTVVGYQAWADGLRPLLEAFLGPRAAVDEAPPPTGDPSLRPAVVRPATE